MKFPLIALSTALTLSSVTASAAEQAAGITANSLGLGITYSRVLIDGSNGGEQLQLRTSYAGAEVENEDDIEISDIDYEIDADSSGVQLGLDWFPFNGKYTKSVFISGGLTYANIDVDGRSERFQVYNVGGQTVAPSDDVTLNTEIDYEGFAPYLSVGWGNRLHQNRNWYLQTELGLTAPLDDTEVKLTATDPNNVLTAEQIAAERAQLEDDVDGLGLFGSVSITYRF